MKSPHNRRVDPRTLRQRTDVDELFAEPPKPKPAPRVDVPEEWDENEPPPEAA